MPPELLHYTRPRLGVNDPAGSLPSRKSPVGQLCRSIRSISGNLDSSGIGIVPESLKRVDMPSVSIQQDKEVEAALGTQGRSSL